MSGLRLVLRDPPPWLEPAVRHPRLRTLRHRVYNPGECWYATPHEDGWTMYGDGDEMHRILLTLAPEHAKARPMIVVLPNDLAFCLHSPTLSEKGWGKSGWTVEGDLPDVTVRPSIDVRGPGGWHGSITAGSMA